MAHPRRRRLPALAIATVASCLSVSPGAQQLTPVPFDQSVSVYVAHDGTWLNYRSQAYDEAEIEDFVAAFIPPEQITDDPEVWAEHQINDPQIPASWLFFEAVQGQPMELHVVIRDTGNRLGQVVVTDRYTEDLVGTLDADPLGLEIDGRLPVAPTLEGLDLNVKDTEGGTLILAAADKAELNDAVAAMHVYMWEANSGDEHAGCPADRQPPWGSPADARGKHSLDDGSPPAVRRVCCGRNEFSNDKQTTGDKRPQYMLYGKDRLRDEARLDPALLPAAARALAGKIEAAQDMFPVADAPLNQRYETPPFSQGVVHFPADVEGRVASVVCVPYRSKTATKSVVGPLIEAKMLGATTAGGNSDDPAQSWAAGISFTPLEVKQWRVVGGGRAAGNVWGLYATKPAESLESLNGITSPVTFELWADRVPPPPGAPGSIGGSGAATVDEAWTTTSPPEVMEPQVALDFPEDGENQGRCTVELPKGWKWEAKGQPSPHYSEGTVDPFHVPVQRNRRISCQLQVLMCLRVETKDPQGNPAEADVELYQRGPAGGYPPGPTQSGQTSDVEGHQVWSSNPLSPGAWKARARARFGADPQWVWSSRGEDQEFGIVPRLLAEMTITVDPGEPPPP